MMVMMMILGATFYGSSSMLKFVNQSRGRKFHTAAARVRHRHSTPIMRVIAIKPLRLLAKNLSLTKQPAALPAQPAAAAGAARVCRLLLCLLIFFRRDGFTIKFDCDAPMKDRFIRKDV